MICGRSAQIFRIQPRPARRNFSGIRSLVDASLPSGLPLEMLHHICDVHTFPPNAGLDKRGVQQLASGSHKRLPLHILLITRLLPNEHHLARGVPSPTTVWVAFRHRSQALQPRAAPASWPIGASAGISFAADRSSPVLTTRCLDPYRCHHRRSKLEHLSSTSGSRSCRKTQSPAFGPSAPNEC